MIAKCTKCQHEWQTVDKAGDCDWCGAPGYRLADDYMEDEEWLRNALDDIVPTYSEPLSQLRVLAGKLLELVELHGTHSKEVMQFVIEYNHVEGFCEVASISIALIEYYEDTLNQTRNHFSRVSKALWCLLTGAFVIGIGIGMILYMIVLPML